ncbi:MAG: hypothetical protein OHK93_003825 [Ramalina farinacea]|uniref:Uncharacterized protein n=1 Tax=Ramalina farinacea TaxID=258253 RepID=A0AA43QIQ1_9LECA|nr:hypothetical protein [Ramalina farinacea]
MIYKLVFDESYKVIWKSDDEDPPPASLSLLLVSSTMHKEAHDPLYHESTFIFDLQDYRAVPPAVYKAKVQAARNARLIVHHINDPWSNSKHLTARVDRFIRTFANKNNDRRRLELDLNKFFIERLTNWVTLRHFASFETVEIHALVSSRTVYGGHRFHADYNDAMTPHKSRRHMDSLVRMLKSHYGSVEATRSGTEKMTRLDWRIRDSSAFYLHLTVRPQQAATRGLGQWG